MDRKREDYIKYDKYGRWVNIEFPPDSYSKYPRNSGYRTESREALFDIFAIQYYDMIIKYHNIELKLIADIRGCYVEDMTNNRISMVYPTANDLIMNFRFYDGKTLVDVIDDNNFDIDIYC